MNKRKIILSVILATFMLCLTACNSSTSSKKGDSSIDLTELNSNATYAAVFDIMSSPKEKIGKKIRVKGYFAKGDDGKSGETYYFCIIPDAMKCCEQGMEFRLKDEADYPSEGDEITIEGIFKEHKDGKNKFYRLDDAKIIT